MSEDLRQFPRKQIQIEVELFFLSDDPRTVITRDVSLGGLFMRLKDPEHYRMGDMVHLRYKDPLGEFEEIEKDAVIVRHADDGIGVAFVEMEEF